MPFHIQKNKLAFMILGVVLAPFALSSPPVQATTHETEGTIPQRIFASSSSSMYDYKVLLGIVGKWLKEENERAKNTLYSEADEATRTSLYDAFYFTAKMISPEYLSELFNLISLQELLKDIDPDYPTRFSSPNWRIDLDAVVSHMFKGLFENIKIPYEKYANELNRYSQKLHTTPVEIVRRSCAGAIPKHLMNNL